MFATHIVGLWATQKLSIDFVDKIQILLWSMIQIIQVCIFQDVGYTLNSVLFFLAAMMLS